MIIWIASYPKSGNTWVRALLAYYFFSRKETFNFTLLKNIPNFNVADFIDEKSPLKDNNDIIKNWIPVQQFIHKKFKRNLFFKTHNVCTTKDGHKFTDNNVSAGCIYIIRDPRNVITSYKNFENQAYEKILQNILDDKNFLLSNKSTFEKFGIRGIEIISSWAEHYNSWIHNKYNIPICLIKYEDLLKDSAQEFIKIFDFLKKINQETKTEIDRKRLEKTVLETNFENLKKLELKFGFDEKQKRKVNFFNQGRENNWTQILPKNISLEIEKKFATEMKELGYL